MELKGDKMFYDNLTKAHGFNIKDESEDVKIAFTRIAELCVLDDENVSDGEVLDIIYDYLCNIGVELQ